MKFGNKGQSAWFDILIIFLCMTIFIGLMWAYTLTAKSPGTNNQMRMQDYAQSLLIRNLYATLDSTDPRYEGKSVADMIGIYLSHPAAFELDNGQPKIVKKAIETMMKSKAFKDRPESKYEWFLFDSDEKNKFCLHVINSKVENCPSEAVESNLFSSSTIELFTAKASVSGGSTNSGGLYDAGGYEKKNVKLTIVWSRE